MSSLAALSSERVEPLLERAIRAQKAGVAHEAERLYRAALAVAPEHSEANHNLAILLVNSGRLDEALQLFRTALENDGERDLYWLSFARALILANRPAEAIDVLSEGQGYILLGPIADALIIQAQNLVAPTHGVAPVAGLAERQAIAMAAREDFGAAAARLRAAIAQQPSNERLLLQLGNMLAEAGAVEGAMDAFEQALSCNPALAEAHYHLGSMLSESGRVAEGFAHLMERAKLVHSASQAESASEPPHKTKHDIEQRTYLISHGIVDKNTAASPFHVGDGERIEGRAVNLIGEAVDLKELWEKASPQFLVFDDFLVPQALEKLRAYCADSTIWKRVYDAGYIGATPADGFACPLLAQIVEEVQEIYGAILKHQPFRYLGAFKYDSELSTGTNTHADFSAINVNLYITPDDANLKSDRGGMVIWDVAAESEAELRRYNSDEQALQQLLEKRGAKATRIAHRTNRAVIFASRLFHRTDECAFREGYLNKRINVSFLYGDWNTAAGRLAQRKPDASHDKSVKTS